MDVSLCYVLSVHKNGYIKKLIFKFFWDKPYQKFYGLSVSNFIFNSTLRGVVHQRYNLLGTARFIVEGSLHEGTTTILTKSQCWYNMSSYRVRSDGADFGSIQEWMGIQWEHIAILD